MFCPQCGITQGDELKFCKSCGVNLHAVRQVAATRDTEEKFDWSKTWVAEMLLSSDEHKRRKQQRQNAFTAEERRYNEIKAGVMTSCVGLGVMIFLAIFMEGIIAAGIPPNAAAILSHVWIAGVIPFFVGLALIFNGVIVSKKLVEMARRELPHPDAARKLEAAKDEHSLAAADWHDADSASPSVTEHTTRELRDSRQRQ